MRAFKEGTIQLLVATTVIEVGVDVPNASLMIIENAERMGLSQLHQLRGRVGRGAAQSHCVLLYKAPLGRIARERLAVLRNTNDGFVVAQRDLDIVVARLEPAAVPGQRIGCVPGEVVQVAQGLDAVVRVVIGRVVVDDARGVVPAHDAPGKER